MAQSTNIKIAGRPYNISAASAEDEEVIRIAATQLNDKINEYQEMFPTKGLIEILSLISLNSYAANIWMERHIEDMEGAEKGLARELERYLENIDKTSR